MIDEYGSIFVDMYDEPQLWNGYNGSVWIWNLYVCPHSRRKGHARRLLEEAEFRAYKAGHKDVFLQWRSETPAEILDFYKRQGYREIYADCARTEIMLRKVLKGGSE